MAKKTRGKSAKDKLGNRGKAPSSEAWLSMRTALIIMGVVSAGLAVLVGWNAIQTQGVLMGIMWGLIFGAGNWLVFFVAYQFFKWSRGQ